MPTWTINEVKPPERLRHPHREVNLLWYGPSRILTAQTEAGAIGAIRFARRLDSTNQGLVTDPFVEEPFRARGVAAGLIQAAEKALRQDGVMQIDAVVLDGQRLTAPFFLAGYQPFRKTVVLEWDLRHLKNLKPPGAIPVVVVDRINQEEVAELVFASYQPYWQWWKETGQEQPLGRVEYPADQPPALLSIGKQRNWPRVIERLRTFNTGTPQRMVVARQGGTIVGLCDVKADPEDSMDWGALVSREHGGRALGSALLGPALRWLQEQGLKSAQTTTTSGLDDYDPTVYLYTVVGGAKIVGEFLVFRRRA